MKMLTWRRLNTVTALSPVMTCQMLHRSTSAPYTSNNTTLKRDCPTRWNSLLNMLQCLLKSRELAERSLTRLRKFEKISTLDQWQTIDDLVKFLLMFKKTTELLSSSEYTKSGVALFFRADLVSALKVSSTDVKVLTEFKSNIRAALDHLFSRTDLHVCAAVRQC